MGQKYIFFAKKVLYSIYYININKIYKQDFVNNFLHFSNRN